MASRLLLAAGGTGGHMFPAQSLAEELVGRGWEVAMITDARGRKHAGRIPADLIVEVSAASISPRRPIAAIGGSLKLARGVRQAKRVIAEFRPDVVAGFGGYPAFPAMRAAQGAGLPTVLHEQNAVLGRVNRVFARKASVVASGFADLAKLPAEARHQVVGNPLRAAIRDAVTAYSPPTHQINLLIIGGSLGARVIAQAVPKAVAQLDNSLRARLRVVQQTPESELEGCRAAYAEMAVDAVCESFFGDIERHLANAHYIIGRAGASSVGEIAAMGRPSLLIPLAIAMDDHQTANASSLVRRGAADILPESELSPVTLSRILMERLHDTDWLENAAQAARSAAYPDAAHDLADIVQSLA